MYVSDYDLKHLGQQKLDEMIAETARERVNAGGYDVIIPHASDRARAAFKAVALKVMYALGWQGSRKARRRLSSVRTQHMAAE